MTEKGDSTIDEDRVYRQIAKELETGATDKGIWTRLYAECNGDEKQTKVLYIKQRADRLISAERLRFEQAVREDAAETERVDTLFSPQSERPQIGHTRNIVKADSNESASVEVRWAWAVVLVITPIAIVMFERESFMAALGSTTAGIVFGFLVSPVLWLISRLFAKFDWHWYHWFNSAAFTGLAVKTGYWALVPMANSLVGGP